MVIGYNFQYNKIENWLLNTIKLSKHNLVSNYASTRRQVLAINIEA